MQLPPMNPVDVTDYPQSWPCLTSKKFLSVLAGLQACLLVPKLHVCSCLDNGQVILDEFAADCKERRREVGTNRFVVCLVVCLVGGQGKQIEAANPVRQHLLLS